MYSHKSSKIILAFLSLLILALFAVIYFVYNDIKLKNERISVLDTDLLVESNKQRYLLSTQIQLEKINNDIVRIDHSIVPTGGEVSFIEDLESIAREDKVAMSIDSLVSSAEFDSASSSLSRLAIKAKTKGGWSGTYKLLAQIESLPVKVKVDKLNLVNFVDSVPGSKAPPVNSWDGTFEITVLKYK